MLVYDWIAGFTSAIFLYGSISGAVVGNKNVYKSEGELENHVLSKKIWLFIPVYYVHILCTYNRFCFFNKAF